MTALNRTAFDRMVAEATTRHEARMAEAERRARESAKRYAESLIARCKEGLETTFGPGLFDLDVSFVVETNAVRAAIGLDGMTVVIEHDGEGGLYVQEIDGRSQVFGVVDDRAATNNRDELAALDELLVIVGAAQAEADRRRVAGEVRRAE